MKAAILQCDDVLDKFKRQFVGYSDMIQKMFAHRPERLTFDVFDCQQCDYPDDIHDYDFFITTGSKSSVNDDDAWIGQLVNFIQHLDRHKKKLVGICFGHQLIARAKQCRVEQSSKGWGVGVARNRMLTRPDWMQRGLQELHLIVSHKDQVEQVTEETRVIAESDFCPYFMLQWNDHFLSVQGHPEFCADYSRALMLERKHIIPAACIDEGLRSLNKQPDNHLFSEWIIDFVSS